MQMVDTVTLGMERSGRGGIADAVVETRSQGRCGCRGRPN